MSSVECEAKCTVYGAFAYMSSNTLNYVSEPFDILSWIFILFMCINVVSVTVFLFEWLSPRGYDMQKLPPRGKACEQKEPRASISGSALTF